MVAPKPDRNRSSFPDSQRRALLIPLAVGTFILFGAVFSQTAFNLKLLRPDSVQQTLVLVALSALVFLLLVALTFVLLRNLLKLYAERRIGLPGSRFRTRMVIGALLLSFVPALVMFLFSYGLMNRSVNRWFSRPVEELGQDSGYVATLLSDYAGNNARHEAMEIAASPEAQHAFTTGNFSGVLNEFRRHQPTLQGGFALALADDGAVASWNAPQPWGALRKEFRPLAEIERRPQKWSYGAEQYLLGAALVRGPETQNFAQNSRQAPKEQNPGEQNAGEQNPGEQSPDAQSPAVRSPVHILVGLPLPADFSPTLDKIKNNQSSYLALSRESKQIRGLYMLLLTLLTVLVLFAATWVSIFAAKLVTKPVEALAEATREISLGHLGHRVEISAADELGELVASFNSMAAELESGRKKIEQSAVALTQTNNELEERRRHIQTVLENIPTGVLSLDPEQRVTHSNVALGRMFWPEPEASVEGAPAAGSRLREIFSSDVAVDLEYLLRKADRRSVTAAQLEIPVARGKLNVSVTASSVQHGRQRLGYVLVFEDFSDLLKAQKEAAWREVARRVAHEIKNPLTPIALSAERILRHLDRGAAPDESSLAIIHGCAETIGGAVETVRSLVDEFSSLARFPTARPGPAHVGEIVENTLAMFQGRLEGIRVEKQLDANLPQAMADPEAIKRALANLIDNAAEAMQDSFLREIHISTALVESKDAVEIVVADTGHGVTREQKEKLFLPYFSTKKRGTGLGLAIVRRIVEDHHGSIRVEENQPFGSRFIVELPLAGDTLAPELRHA